VANSLTLAESNLVAALVYCPRLIDELEVNAVALTDEAARDLLCVAQALYRVRGDDRPISVWELQAASDRLPERPLDRHDESSLAAVLLNGELLTGQAASNWRLVREEWRRREYIQRIARVTGPETNVDEAIPELRRLCDDLEAQTPAGRKWLMAGELLDTYPALKPSLLWGLLRRGEVMNIIAASKTNKSWLANAVALTVVTGRKLWEEFWATPCRVLVIDNELHQETIAFRLPEIAGALGIKREEYADNLAVWSMRGKQTDVNSLTRKLTAVKPGEFGLIVLDAWYRLIPEGKDENSNADVVKLYNTLDEVAQRLDSAIIVVHHSSKGAQGNKSVTDVGAGAGAQSRAADSHLVLRPHETDGVVVVDTALRSWPPIRPFCMRWEFPIWVPDPHSDPSLLKTDRPAKKRPEETPPDSVWDAARFARELLTETPAAKAALVDDAIRAGVNERKASSLLKAAVAKGMAWEWPGGCFATIAPPDDLPEAKTGSKKQLVLNALAADPEADSQAIADRTGVTKRYVNTIKSEMGSTAV
jgi:hypothetical protein